MKTSVKPSTLVIIHRSSEVLLGMKKRGFGAGRWNGFGGKVEPGERVEQAARRELREEASIEAGELSLTGRLDFEFETSPEILRVYIFRGEDFTGQPQPSEEMSPAWFFVDEIPFADMWPDDIHWFPLFLSKRKFTGRFLFDPEENILEKELHSVKKIDIDNLEA